MYLKQAIYIKKPQFPEPLMMKHTQESWHEQQMTLKKVSIMYLHDHQWKQIWRALQLILISLEGRLTDWRENTEQAQTELQMQGGEINKKASPFTSSKEKPETLFS